MSSTGRALSRRTLRDRHACECVQHACVCVCMCVSVRVCTTRVCVPMRSARHACGHVKHLCACVRVHTTRVNVAHNAAHATLCDSLSKRILFNLFTTLHDSHVYEPYIRAPGTAARFCEVVVLKFEDIRFAPANVPVFAISRERVVPTLNSEPRTPISEPHAPRPQTPLLNTQAPRSQTQH